MKSICAIKASRDQTRIDRGVLILFKGVWSLPCMRSVADYMTVTDYTTVADYMTVADYTTVADCMIVADYLTVADYMTVADDG